MNHTENPVDEPFYIGDVRITLSPTVRFANAPACAVTITSQRDSNSTLVSAQELRYLAARLTLAALHVEAVTRYLVRSVSHETTGGADAKAG
jgi:PHD/YefM family antitoxin component YafN of YafNO toxin-antitoxin module